MAHKDLSEAHRAGIEAVMADLVFMLAQDGQSLGLARETLQPAFDRAAEEMEADDGDA